MSHYSFNNYNESRNIDKNVLDIKDLKKVSKTHKLSVPKINGDIKLPKKIRINKFLTKVLMYEGKRNFDLEKIRFNELWKEKNSLNEGPFSTSRTITGRNVHKKTLKKNMNKTYQEINSKPLTEKLGDKNSINNTRRNKKAMSSERIKKFWEKQEDWAKAVIDKKNNIKQKIFQRNENELNQYFYPKTNRNYDKIKYKYEKTLEQVLQKCEADLIKKKYIQKTNSYIHKPATNINKYKNISSKYNKYLNKNNNKNNYYKKKKDNNEIKKIKIDKYNNDSKIVYSSRNKKNNFIYNVSKEKKQSYNKKLLKFLTTNINNNSNDKSNNENIYYLNVNERTSCDTFINKVVYKGHNSIIEQIILEKLENIDIKKEV